jgi:hypothetical protein
MKGTLRYNPCTMTEITQLEYIDPVIEAYKKDIDRTLIRENLRLTVEQRIINLMKLQEFAEELRKSKERPGNDANKLS